MLFVLKMLLTSVANPGLQGRSKAFLVRTLRAADASSWGDPRVAPRHPGGNPGCSGARAHRGDPMTP